MDGVIDLGGNFGTQAAERGPELPVLITPEKSFFPVHKVLYEREAVHPVASPRDLRAYRLGYASPGMLLKAPHSNKLAFAKMSGGEVSAVIYAHLSGQPGQGFQSLPGNMHSILSTKSRMIENTDRLNTITFYSIFNAGKSAGAGRELIQSMMSLLNNVPLRRTTLSPFRDFNEWLSAKNLEPDMSDDARIDRALERLLEQGDKVQRFHMGNGAVLGDIKLDVNAPSSQDAATGMNVGINYPYPDPDALKYFAGLFREGRKVAMAEHLYERLPPALRGNAEKVYAREIFAYAPYTQRQDAPEPDIN